MKMMWRAPLAKVYTAPQFTTAVNCVENKLYVHNWFRKMNGPVPAISALVRARKFLGKTSSLNVPS
jgi:hypothetical protein